MARQESYDTIDHLNLRLKEFFIATSKEREYLDDTEIVPVRAIIVYIMADDLEVPVINQLGYWLESSSALWYSKHSMFPMSVQLRMNSETWEYEYCVIVKLSGSALTLWTLLS